MQMKYAAQHAPTRQEESQEIRTRQSQITHTVKIEISCCGCINLCVFEGCMNVTVGVNKTSVRLVRFIAVRR